MQGCVPVMLARALKLWWAPGTWLRGEVGCLRGEVGSLPARASVLPKTLAPSHVRAAVEADPWMDFLVASAGPEGRLRRGATQARSP